jgi:hypothetical protein
LKDPIPLGQPPPPPSERFHASTGVAVNGDLAVVGVKKYDDGDDQTTGYAIIAYNTLNGTQRWIYRVDAEVLPDPVITNDKVIFGTANGRAYALIHDAADASRDGTVLWQTTYNNRLRYALYPFSQGQIFSDTKLYGPALDGSREYAYFGGSDGAVHRYSIASGGVLSSRPLLYYWDYSTDQNGANRYRPCACSTPPAICRNQCLALEVFTQRSGSGGFSYLNGAYVCLLPLPGLDWTPYPAVSEFTYGMRVDAGDGVFRDGGNVYNAVKVGAIASPSSGYPVTAFDPILQIGYLLDPVFGFFVDTATYSSTYSPDGLGGVSFGSGYLLATDKGGVFWGIPSNVRARVDTGGLVEGPFLPGPPPYNPPLVLGPIEVYPNPFNPATAVGGILKFRNLPVGSYVELTTLAYERVATLREANNTAHWDGKNVAGQIVAPGTYLYRIWLPDNKPPVTGRIALTRN